MIAILFWLCVAFIVYTYFGYPLLLGIIPKKPTWISSEKYEPSVTLIIAAYNEEKCIVEKIQNSLDLDYPKEKLQILVAADGSSDNTVTLVKQFSDQGVEICFQPTRQGKLAAISRAIEFAKGELLVFSDANNMFAPDAIQKLIAPFSSKEVGAVSGAKHILKNNLLHGESEGLYWKYESFIKKNESALGSCTGVSGEIFAIRKNLFKTPPAGIINDDFYMAMQVLRHGFRVIYQPEAISFEHVSLTQQDEVIRRTRINVGRYQSIWMAKALLPYKHPLLMWQIISHKIFRLFLPFAFIGALITSFISLFSPSHTEPQSWWHLTYPVNWIIFGLQILFYFVAWIGSRSKKNNLLGKILYIPSFLFSSNIAALLGFWHFITRKNQVLWQKVQRFEEENDASRS